MRTLRSYAAASLTAMIGAAGLAAGAAAAESTCETYGRLALQQQQENLEGKCGFTGPQWSSDLKAHIAWCAGVGPDTWKGELKRRQQQLDACKAR